MNRRIVRGSDSLREKASEVRQVACKEPDRPSYASEQSETLQHAISTLLDIHGVVACRNLTRRQLTALLHIEAESNVSLRIPGLEIVNEGIRDVSSRRFAVAIAHTSELRHPPGPILMICCGNQVVGEEVWNNGVIDGSTTLLLGRGLKLYRSALEISAGKPLKFIYGALRFPELETVSGVRDVISVTVTTLTHMRLSRLVGLDERDPNIGTVLIGFNS